MIRRKNLKPILLCLIVCAAVLPVSGCFTRTIYVPDGAPVRLRQDVRGVKIWAKDANGKWVPGTMTLQDGWYCLSDPGENE